MMAATTPSSPGAPNLIIQSNEMIEFYWNEPYDNGGTSITFFEIQIVRVSDSAVFSITVINSNRYLYQSAALGFLAGNEYLISVKGHNFITEYYSLSGAWSAVSTFYSSVLPSTVSPLTYTSLSMTGATIEWNLLTS